jgi:hypothetical protein
MLLPKALEPTAGSVFSSATRAALRVGGGSPFGRSAGTCVN